MQFFLEDFASIFSGSIGLLLLYGISAIPPKKYENKEEKLREENVSLRKNNKVLKGQSFQQQDAIGSLVWRMKMKEREKKNLLASIDRLNREQVRLEKELRSREFELHEERRKKLGRR